MCKAVLKVIKLPLLWIEISILLIILPFILLAPKRKKRPMLLEEDPVWCVLKGSWRRPSSSSSQSFAAWWCGVLGTEVVKALCRQPFSRKRTGPSRSAWLSKSAAAAVSLGPALRPHGLRISIVEVTLSTLTYILATISFGLRSSPFLSFCIQTTLCMVLLYQL